MNFGDEIYYQFPFLKEAKEFFFFNRQFEVLGLVMQIDTICHILSFFLRGQDVDHFIKSLSNLL